jgi:PTS system beta-glucosides-specific IIC component
LKDSGLVDLDKIKQLKGVIGAQYATDQLQIIIGNDVSDDLSNRIAIWLHSGTFR